MDDKSVSLKFVRVLKASPGAKRICIECLYNDEPAILVLEKSAFEEDIVEHIASNFRYLNWNQLSIYFLMPYYFSSDSLVNAKNLFRNDIFGTYLADIGLRNYDPAKNTVNNIAINIIHPARPKDIEKYIDHPYNFVLETAELYKTVTKPFIEKQVATPGHLQWVYNILEKKAEVKSVVITKIVKQ